MRLTDKQLKVAENIRHRADVLDFYDVQQALESIDEEGDFDDIAALTNALEAANERVIEATSLAVDLLNLLNRVKS